MPITLVPTPIGNLEDITLRALRTLREADLIAAEDTRTSGQLLRHFGVDRPLVSLHAHNEHSRVPQLVARVKAEGLRMAVVSDAGTPGISDPGFLVVREAIAQGVEIEALPGPTALVPALVASGLPCDRFVFEGFLPLKKGRQARLKAIAAADCTSVLYESPHRLHRLLAELAQHCTPERRACVCREISKLYAETARGTLAELAARFPEGQAKGEIVVVIAGE